MTLRCRGLVVGYGDSVIIDGLDLEVGYETVALLGPSGSGKTTLLHAIAGLLPLRAGSVEIAGRDVTGLPPEQRSIGMVFQNYALWPHLDALETVAYPMRRKGVAADAAWSEARRLLDAMGIAELAERRPDQLSGGQQQRVGLARAMASEPDLSLFDEPTAHLDAALRHTLQSELVAHGRAVPTLYTTHDAGEALAVGDRVAVMRGGRIVQIATPDEVYDRPVDAWCARLTGPASVVETEGGALGGEPIPGLDPDTERVVIRPDWASLGGTRAANVGMVRFEGPHTDYGLDIQGGRVTVRAPGAPQLAVGQSTGWTLHRCWPVGD